MASAIRRLVHYVDCWRRRRGRRAVCRKPNLSHWLFNSRETSACRWTPNRKMYRAPLDNGETEIFSWFIYFFVEIFQPLLVFGLNWFYVCSKMKILYDDYLYFHWFSRINFEKLAVCFLWFHEKFTFINLWAICCTYKV